MNKRPYGSTGKSVSEIGFGAWQLGNAKDWSAGLSEKEAIYLVHEAIDRGCNFFDTAPTYGQGKSEDLLGNALKGKREDVIINTKFGHNHDGKTDYSADLIRTSVEESLKRLQTDYLDSILLHNPPFEYLNGSSRQYDALEGLKKEGKIGAYGVSVDSSREMFEVLNTTNSQVMEVLFNIFHQETAKAFQMAQEKKVGLIIKVPLDSGWLSGKYNAQSTFDDVRSRWTPEVVHRRAQLLEKISTIADDETSLTQAALQFVLAHPEVSTVIPGIKNFTQLEENLNASKKKMPVETVKELQKLYKEEIENSLLPW
jgi:aryl-alcohol dehydrogenase-like predicted oxidoreductase